MSLVQCSIDYDETDDPFENAWDDIITTLVLYGAIGLVMFMVFEWKRGNLDVYACRAALYPDRVPEPRPLGCLAWVKAIIAFSDREVLEYAGLDAFVLLRFLTLALWTSFAMMIWGLVVLMPIYGTGGGNVSALNSFAQLTMDNLSQQSPRLWASVISAYLFTGIVLFGINLETLEYAQVRLDFLINGDVNFFDQYALTARVEMIPKAMRSEAELKAYFERLFPKKIVDAVVFMDIQPTKLESKVEKARKLCEQLETTLAYRTCLLAEHKKQEGHIKEESRCPCFKGKEGGYDADIPMEEPTMMVMAPQCSFCQDESVIDVAEDKESTPNELKTSRNVIESCDTQDVDEDISRCDNSSISVSKNVEESQVDVDKIETSNTQAVVVRENVCWKTVFAVPYLEDELWKANAEIAAIQKINLEHSESIESKAVRQIEQNESSWTESVTDDEDEDLTNLKSEIKSSSGYVTFATKAVRGYAVQVLLSNNENSVEVFPATDPRAIIWANCTLNLTESSHRHTIVSVAVTAFALLVFIPLLVFCNVFGDIERLSKIIPGLDSLEPGSFAYDFITGQLPVLLQSLLIGLLPAILTAVATNIERLKLLTMVDRSVVDRGFGLQLVNIYFTLLGKSLASTIADIASEPGCIFTLLGASVPAQASYFIQFILINALFGLTMELSRVVPLLLTSWFSYNAKKHGASSIARHKLFEGNASFSGATAIPGIILVMILQFTYAVIVPVLSIASVLYFSMALTIYRNNFLYVYAGSYESGGELFWTLCGYTLTGLNFANVTLMGYMIIKEGIIEFVVLIPILIIVEWFRGSLKTKNVRRCNSLGLEAVAELDAKEGDGSNRVFDLNLYRQPALRQTPFKPSPFILDIIQEFISSPTDPESKSSEE